MPRSFTSAAHYLMLRGSTSRERRLGRMMMRGRVRMSPELASAYAAADAVVKDFGSSAGGTTTADAVHTDTAGPTRDTQERRHNKQTRLRGVW